MAEIRCICLDVDGVLTDGRLFYHDDGSSSRAFHVWDGFAIKWWQKLGGEFVLISGKISAAAAARAKELGIVHVRQGSADKLSDLKALIGPLNIRLEEVAAIGDDLPELPLLRKCGFAVAVANAVQEVKDAAHYVTTLPGGHGAVRELIELLLRRNGKWPQVLAHFEQLAAGGAAAPAWPAGRSE